MANANANANANISVDGEGRCRDQKWRMKSPLAVPFGPGVELLLEFDVGGAFVWAGVAGGGTAPLPVAFAVVDAFEPGLECGPPCPVEDGGAFSVAAAAADAAAPAEPDGVPSDP